MKGCRKIIAGAVLILLAGCGIFSSPNPNSFPPPAYGPPQVGPDTYFEGPDWIPHQQKTIGERLNYDHWHATPRSPDSLIKPPTDDNDVWPRQKAIDYWVQERMRASFRIDEAKRALNVAMDDETFCQMKLQQLK